MSSFVRARRLVLLSLGALALVALGCGDGKGYRLTGKVTFKGQPIPVGKIYFNPDGSKVDERLLASMATGLAPREGRTTKSTSCRCLSRQ